MVKNPIAEQATGLGFEIQESVAEGSVNDQMPPPATAVGVALERWDSPKRNRWRVLATFASVSINSSLEVSGLGVLTRVSICCDGHVLRIVSWSLLVDCRMPYSY